MGGDGSGRKPDVIKMARDQEATIKFNAPDIGFEIPNYSGVRPEALKTSSADIASNWTVSGSNIYNSNTGNIGIGTTAPVSLLSVRSAGVDGTYQDILTGLYANDIEKNSIQTSVSTNAYNSGFRFLISNGSGLSAQTLGYQMNRDSQHFYISGSEKVTIDSSGNVGIGTAGPQDKLDISSGHIRLSPNYFMGTYLATWRPMFGSDSTGHGQTVVRSIDTDAGDGIQFQNFAGSSLMEILNTGNVGIGTTSPGTKLHIAGDGPTIRLEGNGASALERTWQISEAAQNYGSLGFQQSTAKGGTSWNMRMLIDENGNVGIGTTSPQVKFQVSEPAGTYPSPPALGSHGGTFEFLSDGGTYGLIGGTASTGNSWLQVQRVDGAGNAYNMLLQPSGGNVGIGTTNPGQKLDVAGAIRTSSSLYFGSATNPTRNYVTQSSIRLTSANDLNVLDIIAGDTLHTIGSNFFGGGSNIPILLTAVNGGTNQLYLATTGNVGIGTTSPGSQLTLSGGAVIEMSNAADTTPTIALSGGIFLSGGALWYKGFAGTYTQLAAA